LAAGSITSKAHLHAVLLELQGAGLIREVHQELAGDPLFAAFHVYTFNDLGLTRPPGQPAEAAGDRHRATKQTHHPPVSCPDLKERSHGVKSPVA
jgi:hypothetical protein